MNAENKEYLLMNFGFVQNDIRCGDGWFPLVKNMCEIMRDEIKQFPSKYENFEIVCIKEKMGDLRVYFNLEWESKFLKMEDLMKEPMWRIASKACEAADTICEVCGAKGAKLRGNNDGLTYLSRQCDSCLATEPERRKATLEEWKRERRI